MSEAEQKLKSRPTYQMIMNVQESVNKNVKGIAFAILVIVLLMAAQFGMMIASIEMTKEMKSSHDSDSPRAGQKDDYANLMDVEGRPVATGKQTQFVDLFSMHNWEPEFLDEVEELTMTLPLVQHPTEASHWLRLKMNVQSYLLHPAEEDGKEPILVWSTPNGNVIICERGIAFESPDEFLANALKMVAGGKHMMDDGSFGGLVQARRHLMGTERKLVWLPLLYYGAMCASNPACVAVGMAVLRAGVSYCCVHAPPPPPGGNGQGGDYASIDYFNTNTWENDYDHLANGNEYNGEEGDGAERDTREGK